MPKPVARSLQRYREMRDFERTPEPSGAVHGSAQQLEFVVQRHHARRRTTGATVEFIAPQLATSSDEVPASGHWLTELKFDGYRILAAVDGGHVQCFSRSGHDWTHRMPGVAEALRALALQDSWLDGELVAAGADGMPQFQKLQQALDPASGEQPILMVFDGPRLLGADLRDQPQLERKRLLQQALANLRRSGPVRLVDFVDGESATLRQRVCAQGFEGVILKDATAPYRSGRNRAWLKLKCRREQEFVVGGYTRTDAGRNTLTALLLGYYDHAGQLLFAGRAGTGFSEKQLNGLRRQLDALAQDDTPFAVKPSLRRGERPQWVRPELVAQVRFAEWTESGILRQPLFLGLREDVAARGVRREPDRIAPVAHGGESIHPPRATRDGRRGEPARPVRGLPASPCPRGGACEPAPRRRVRAAHAS